MGPIVKELSKEYQGKSIEFVTFDFTSKDTRAKADETAKKLGVEDLYKKNKGTGFLLLVDTKSGRVLEKLSARVKTEEWRSAIDKGLTGA